ncbi:MAG: hypothetical protein L0170_04130, partial [Acidobacteria bacterium]|nr:hypothetical protein [Acidobacteriota bacterium]
MRTTHPTGLFAPVGLRRPTGDIQPAIYCGLRVSSAALLIVSVLGCTRNLSHDDLIGTYRIERQFGVETLVLEGDGSFEQEIVPPGGEVVRSIGTWDAPGPRPKRLVVLSDA